MIETNYQYPQMVMNWGVYLTMPDGQGGVPQAGQSLYSDPWSSPVSTVNSVNTVTSLLKTGQNYFGTDAWSSMQLNGINPVRNLYHHPPPSCYFLLFPLVSHMIYIYIACLTRMNQIVFLNFNIFPGLENDDVRDFVFKFFSLSIL